MVIKGYTKLSNWWAIVVHLRTEKCQKIDYKNRQSQLPPKYIHIQFNSNLRSSSKN